MAAAATAVLGPDATAAIVAAIAAHRCTSCCTKASVGSSRCSNVSEPVQLSWRSQWPDCIHAQLHSWCQLQRRAVLPTGESIGVCSCLLCVVCGGGSAILAGVESSAAGGHLRHCSNTAFDYHNQCDRLAVVGRLPVAASPPFLGCGFLSHDLMAAFASHLRTCRPRQHSTLLPKQHHVSGRSCVY